MWKFPEGGRLVYCRSLPLSRTFHVDMKKRLAYVEERGALLSEYGTCPAALFELEILQHLQSFHVKNTSLNVGAVAPLQVFTWPRSSGNHPNHQSFMAFSCMKDTFLEGPVDGMLHKSWALLNYRDIFALMKLWSYEIFRFLDYLNQWFVSFKNEFFHVEVIYLST